MKFLPGNTPQGTFSIIIALSLILALKVGFALNAPEGYFSQNLLPEITGMLIELALMLFLVEQWKRSNKQEQLIVKEKRLRELLIFFLRHSFKSLPLEYRVGTFYGDAHNDNIIYLDKLIGYIDNNSLPSNTIDEISAQCSQDLITYGNLLPVVSELTEQHFKAWIRIIFFMKKISENHNEIEEHTKFIINNIKKFETASYNHGIYVGSPELKE